MKLVLALIFFLFPLTLFAQDITYDLGGSVQDRLEEIKHLDGVRIVGLCVSACTMYLGLPKTCVSEKAKLGFHSPQTKIKTPLLKPDWEQTTQIIAGHYPKALAEWYLKTARFSSEVTYLSGKEVIKLGATPCK